MSFTHGGDRSNLILNWNGKNACIKYGRKLYTSIPLLLKNLVFEVIIGEYIYVSNYGKL